MPYGDSRIGFKGEIKENRYVTNRGVVYFGSILGAGDISDVYFTKSSEIKLETETFRAPDGTVLSTGKSKSFDWTIEVPMHHYDNRRLITWHGIASANLFMYKWTATVIYFRAEHNSSPIFEENFPFTVTNRNNNAPPGASFVLQGIWPKSYSLPPTDKSDNGELATVTWIFSVDSAASTMNYSTDIERGKAVGQVFKRFG